MCAPVCVRTCVCGGANNCGPRHLVRGKFNMFPVSRVYFFVGGEGPKSIAKVDGWGHDLISPPLDPPLSAKSNRVTMTTMMIMGMMTTMGIINIMPIRRPLSLHCNEAFRRHNHAQVFRFLRHITIQYNGAFIGPLAV